VCNTNAKKREPANVGYGGRKQDDQLEGKGTNRFQKPVKSTVTCSRIETTAKYIFLLFINKSTKHHQILRTPILLRREHKQIHDTLRVTPLVIVPRDKLDKFLVQLNASAGIKDRGRSAADEVRRNHRVFCVFDDPLIVAVGGLFQNALYLFIRRLLLETHNKIND
jgi:hypothetical protein